MIDSQVKQQIFDDLDRMTPEQQRRARELVHDLAIASESAPGRRASECVELLRAREPALLDDGFGDDLLQILAEEPLEERPSWDC